MLNKNYVMRPFLYIYKYPKHFIGYTFFGVSFIITSYAFKESKHEIIRIGLAGAIAQFVTEISFHPIDTVNTKTKAEIAFKEINSIKIARRILDKEGIFGFYRGASATYYGGILAGFIYFCSYKYLKTFFSKYEKQSNAKINSLIYLVSSLLAETVTLIFYYPFDLIRTRMQTRMNGFIYQGPVDGIQKMLNGKIRNFKKIYVGGTPCFLLNMANTTILFTVLETCREYFLKLNGKKNINQLSMDYYLLSSITAGVVSGAATNILEVITIQKQCNPNFKLKTFILQQGFKALTSGISARISNNVCHTIMLIFVLDYMSIIFNVEL